MINPNKKEKKTTTTLYDSLSIATHSSRNYPAKTRKKIQYISPTLFLEEWAVQ